MLRQVYYVVVLIVRPHKDGYQLLLARRAEEQYMGGTWQLIAGGVKPGEPAWQAALREMREETGLVPVEFFRLSTLTSFYRPDDDSLNIAPMFCAVVDADAVVSIDAEHTDYEWVPLAEAEARLMWYSDRQALQEVRSEILGNGISKEYLRIRI